jgi:hypothetical protein
MGILMMIGVAILIGVMAQKGKGRTGALWAVMTFILQAALWIFFYPTNSNIRESESIARLVNEHGRDGMATMVSIFTALPLMAIIVATLPQGRAK